MIISHKYQFIFIRTSKTAGTSVEISLSRFCGPDDVVTPLDPEEEYVRRDLGVHPRHFLRPPFQFLAGNMLNLFQVHPPSGRLLTRIVGQRYSAFMSAREVKARVGPDIWDSYTKFAIERDPLDRLMSSYYADLVADRVRTIDEFMAQPTLESNFETYSQDGEIIVDRILRYDQLKEELRDLCGQLGVPFDGWLPRAKANNRRNKRNWRDLLDETQIDRIWFECAREFRVLKDLGAPLPEEVLPLVEPAPAPRPKAPATEAPRSETPRPETPRPQAPKPEKIRPAAPKTPAPEPAATRPAETIARSEGPSDRINRKPAAAPSAAKPVRKPVRVRPQDRAPEPIVDPLPAHHPGPAPSAPPSSARGQSPLSGELLSEIDAPARDPVVPEPAVAEEPAPAQGTPKARPWLDPEPAVTPLERVNGRGGKQDKTVASAGRPKTPRPPKEPVDPLVDVLAEVKADLVRPKGPLRPVPLDEEKAPRDGEPSPAGTVSEVAGTQGGAVDPAAPKSAAGPYETVDKTLVDHDAAEIDVADDGPDGFPDAAVMSSLPQEETAPRPQPDEGLDADELLGSIRAIQAVRAAQVPEGDAVLSYDDVWQGEKTPQAPPPVEPAPPARVPDPEQRPAPVPPQAPATQPPQTDSGSAPLSPSAMMAKAKEGLPSKESFQAQLKAEIEKSLRNALSEALVSRRIAEALQKRVARKEEPSEAEEALSQIETAPAPQTESNEPPLSRDESPSAPVPSVPESSPAIAMLERFQEKWAPLLRPETARDQGSQKLNEPRAPALPAASGSGRPSVSPPLQETPVEASAKAAPEIQIAAPDPRQVRTQTVKVPPARTPGMFDETGAGGPLTLAPPEPPAWLDDDDLSWLPGYESDDEDGPFPDGLGGPTSGADSTMVTTAAPPGQTAPVPGVPILPSTPSK